MDTADSQPARTDLPWDDLADPETIPWDAINRIADALVADRDGTVLAEVQQHHLGFHEDTDLKVGDFGKLHTIAAIASAGPRLTGEQRHALSQWAMQRLSQDAWDDLDIECEHWLRLAVPLLPESVDAAIATLREDDDWRGPWFYAWSFVEAADHCDDEAVRQRAADFAVTTLQRGIDEQIDLEAASRAGYVLAALGEEAYLEPIDRALAAARNRPRTSLLSAEAELSDARECLLGNETRHCDHDGDQPVTEWLERAWEQLHKWHDRVYDQPSESPGFDAAPPPAWPTGGTFRHSEPKVGRNDPCPCGSGKKYKKCCGR